MAQAHEQGAARVLLLATHAVRVAADRAAVVAALEVAAGAPLSVLSPECEAALCLSGAALDPLPAPPFLLADIGGGSTDLALVTAEGVVAARSLPVGSGVLASAVGMDKAVQKVLFEAAGLPVAPWEPVRESEWEEDPEAIEARAESLGYPLFSKPATLGSSVGVRKVHDPGELRGALEEAFRHARKAVLERSVEGAREIECSVLGNDEPVASVAGEILPTGHEFYDYAAKYLDADGARLLIPAEVPSEVLEEIQRIAVAAFEAIDGSGMARVDFFLAPDGALVLNEINTIPGFTSISMYPKLWEASGLSYPDLIDRLIELAIERHDRERKKGTGAAELGANAERPAEPTAPTASGGTSGTG